MGWVGWGWGVGWVGGGVLSGLGVGVKWVGSDLVRSRCLDGLGFFGWAEE